MNAPCYESISRLTIGPWRVRVWRTEAAPDVITDQDLMEAARLIIKDHVAHGTELEREKLLKCFSEFKNVSAVEVTGSDGAGVLQYNDWPN